MAAPSNNRQNAEAAGKRPLATSPATPDKDDADIPSSSTTTPSMFSIEYWTNKFDEQRLERLQQCHSLNIILKQCEAMTATTNKNAPAEKTVPLLDECGPGIRMLRYYDWRHRVPVNQKGCVPERHSVWTCRAVALGCGAHLSQLKQCFDQQGIETVLSQPQTAYEAKLDEKFDTKSIPCWELQRQLGHCVAESAKVLHDKRKRKGS
jgi:hypothetical protein